MTRFRSAPGFEECLCTSCQRKGYGADAWHPCTAQFWPTTHGRLIYTRCKACASESAQHARGIVTAEAA